MSNGLFLNPLLLNTSMALLKLDWWHCISQYCSVWRYTRWYLHFCTLHLQRNRCSVGLN
jgi:hypothetical protein